jgi:hypothetical protein
MSSLRAAAAGLAFLLACALPPVALAQQTRPATENDRYVTFFDSIVFGNEFAGRASLVVRKWVEPIRYKLGGNAAAIAKYRPIIVGHMEQLAIFSGVKFEEIGGREPGENYIIWFSTSTKMIDDGRMLAANPAEVAGRQFETANCFFLSYYLPDGKMVAARVVANSDLPDQELVHCLLEEIAQTLGLPNDDDRVAPSIFNDSLKLMSLSLIDRVLIRLVYDPRMRAGTPRAQALPLARAILTELNPGGG